MEPKVLWLTFEVKACKQWKCQPDNVKSNKSNSNKKTNPTKITLHWIMLDKGGSSIKSNRLYKPLLHWWDSFFLLNPFLDPVNGISWFDINFDFFSSESLDLDHSSTPKPQNQVKCWLLLDVVVCQSSAIFQLFAGKNQPLLIRRDTFLVLVAYTLFLGPG